MTEATIAAPAPAAAAAAPPAPVAEPAPAAPAAPAAPSLAPAPASTVDPGKFPIREDYAAALLNEKLAAIETPEEPVVVEEPAEPVVEPAVEEAPAPEDDFQLEPEAVVTPELLSQLVTDNPSSGSCSRPTPG